MVTCKWDYETEVCITKGELPSKVMGDLNKFRVCFQSLLEFGILYSRENKIQIKCDVQQYKYTPELHFITQFYIILSNRHDIDLEPLEQCFQTLTDEAKEGEQEPDKCSEKEEEDFRENYSKYYDFISEFGLGMVVLPKIIKQLNGECFFNRNDEGMSRTFTEDQLKIGFKIPLKKAGIQAIIQNHQYRINTKQNSSIDNRVQVFRTPKMVSQSRVGQLKQMPDMFQFKS